MTDDLITKKNENKYDDVEDSRGSKFHNQNYSSMNTADEDDNGMDMDGEEEMKIQRTMLMKTLIKRRVKKKKKKKMMKTPMKRKD